MAMASTDSRQPKSSEHNIVGAFSVAGWVNERCSRGLFRLGLSVAEWPVAFIVLPILACGLVGIGISELYTETSYAKVWYPRRTKAWEALSFQYARAHALTNARMHARMNARTNARSLARSLARSHVRACVCRWDHYGEGNQTETFLVVSDQPGKVLTSPILAAAASLHERISRTAGYEAVCQRAYAGGPCQLLSPLHLAWRNVSAVDFAGIADADVAAAVGTIPPNLAPLVLGGAAFEQGAVSASALSSALRASSSAPASLSSWP